VDELQAESQQGLGKEAPDAGLRAEARFHRAESASDFTSAPQRPAPRADLDQVGVVIVEEQLGLDTTSLDDLRGLAARLPFEPCVSLLSILAAVETTINKPAIVEEQVEAALATLPTASQPKAPPGTPLSQTLGQAAAAGFLAAVFPSKESREDFAREVDDYARELRRWLDELAHARSERMRVFVGAARVVERGDAPADHVRLRLRFPPGFEPPEDPPWVSKPPKRPRFNPPLIGFIDPTIDIPPIEPRSFPPLPAAASYWREGEATIVEYDLGRINQADFRDTPEFRLRAAAPGLYQIDWQVSAAGLRRPATGCWQLTVAEPKEREAIVTLEEAVRERVRYGLG
jgi:hypothetical protein